MLEAIRSSHWLRTLLELARPASKNLSALRAVQIAVLIQCVIVRTTAIAGVCEGIASTAKTEFVFGVIGAKAAARGATLDDLGHFGS